jgi:hypothetical protein
MTKFSIKAYAASAISFLTIHQEAEAQVVYVDIDPDIVLSAKRQPCNHRSDTKTTRLLTSKQTFGRQKLG